MLYKLIVFLAFSVAANSQSVFLKGYLIDNTGYRTECFIRPENWQLNSYLNFRLHLLDTLHQKPVVELREFAIYGKVKNILSNVYVDRPEDRPENSEWLEQKVLLNVLVEGKSSLYFAQVENKGYFFCREAAGLIILLSPIPAVTDTTAKSFHRLLRSRFNCQGNPDSYIRTLKYEKPILSEYFIANNRCLGLEAITYPGLSSLVWVGEAQPVPQQPVQAVVKNEPALDNQKSPQQTNVQSTDKHKWHYVNVEINPLIRQVLNFSDEPTPTNNPFQLQYAVNNKTTGVGFAGAFSYARQKFSDNSNGNDFETIARDFVLRLGYEHKQQAGARWIYLYGYDLLLIGGKEETTLDNFGGGITITTKRSGWGMGPRGGIMFQLASQVFIGTEVSLYYSSVVRTEEFPDTPETKQRTQKIEVNLPVAIFLGLRLGN
ncbi:MAG: hypothetical protein L6Q51_03965 [Cyclobacteriaceae bacterium]|nr:hypothetical protein [Cyclobacteriaceae bacterium]